MSRVLERGEVLGPALLVDVGRQPGCVIVARDPDSWTCYSNHVVCCADHLLKYRETGFHADLRRLSGHAFFSCHTCEPASHFFALFVTQPTPAVLCYALSKESYDEWSRSSESDTPETQELLYRLRGPDGESLNSRWRQPR